MTKNCFVLVLALACICVCMRTYADETDASSREDDTVISHYRKIAREHPNTQKAADALYNAGVLHEKQGAFGKAVGFYRLAVSNSADKSFVVKVQLQIGQIYEKTKEYDKAIEVYRDSLDKCSGNEELARVMRQISYAYLAQKKYSEGFEVLKKIIKKFPNTVHASDAQFSIAATYHRKAEDYAKAIDEYKKMVENYPEDWRVPVSLAYIGEIYTKLKNYEKAIETYQEIIEAYPGTNDARAARARIRLIDEYYKKDTIPSPKEMRKIFQEEGINTH